jgi:Acyl-CoA dehydrogenase, C-terminal domain.
MGGHSEEYLWGKGKSYNEAVMSAAEEFAVECAILKVAGSEMLDYVVDEGVQILGGYGFRPITQWIEPIVIPESTEYLRVQMK